MEYNQEGVLGNLNVGERVRNVLPSGDMLSQSGMSELDVPSDPGPALAGRTPVVGTVRRSQGMMVLRDEVKDRLE